MGTIAAGVGWWGLVVADTKGAQALAGATGALVIVAALSPSLGLLVVAALGALGGALSILTGSRFSWTDPLVLAAVTGWLAHRVTRAEPWDRTATALALTMIALAVTSSLVLLGVLAHVTALPDQPPAYQFWAWLQRRHPMRSHALAPNPGSLMRIVAGAALFAMTIDVCRRLPATSGRAMRLLTVGVSAVALLNVGWFVQTIAQHDDMWRAAVELHQQVRVSTTIRDMNAAAAMFLLALPVAAAGIAGRGAYRVVALLCFALLLAGIWLAGSRAVLLMTPLVGAGLLVGPALGVLRRRRLQILGVVALVTVVTFLLYPRAQAHGSAGGALEVRLELLKTTVRMLQDYPIFGVGPGEYYGRSAEYATEGLKRYYARQNAHNQVAQVLGELGVLGGVVFLGLLGVALVPAFQQLALQQEGPETTWLTVAVVGFLVASLTMHPLLIAEVGAAFWVTLGLLRARVAPIAETVSRGLRLPLAVSAVLMLGLALSVPPRVARELGRADLRDHGAGLSRWQVDAATGRQFRTATGPAALFVDGHAEMLQLPLRARRVPSPAVEVDVWVHGRRISTLHVPRDAWREFRMLVPSAKDAPRSLRLELRWSASREARLDVGRELYEAAGDVPAVPSTD